MTADQPEAAATGSPRRVRPNRRELLTGGLGILLGGGAATAAEELGRSTPAPAVTAPSPGEDLMTEHGVLKRILLAYQAMAADLSGGRTPPVGAVRDAAQLIADFIEGFHEGLEEAYVFPRVREQEPALVKTLLVQHDRGRHLTAAISKVAAEGLSEPSARADLLRYLTLFVRMYGPHEAWEDTVVFPLLRQVTPARTLDELAERFADLQHRQYGDDALAQLLDRVAGIEQQLGIATLADFTPPLVYRRDP